MKKNSLGATAPKGYKSVKKADIIAAAAKKANTTQKAAKEIVDAYWDTIKSELKSNKKANVNIPNVGSIRCVTGKTRKYNVSGLKHGKKGKGTITVKGKTTAKFYVSDNFLKSSTPKKRTSTKSRKKTTSTSTANGKTRSKSKSKTKK